MEIMNFTLSSLKYSDHMARESRVLRNMQKPKVFAASKSKILTVNNHIKFIKKVDIK